MTLDQLIKRDNDLLETQAGQDAYLPQRIKARLNSGGRFMPGSRVQLVRNAFIYALLLIALTLGNFALLEHLEEKKTAKAAPLISYSQAFQADFPGSIARAYKEAIK